MKSNSYTLRKRFKNNAMEQLSKKENKLQVLYKLCKPVYVNIIKLPINKSEIKKCCKKDSFTTQIKDISKNRKRKTKDYVKRINSKYNHVHHLCNSKIKTKSQNVLFSKETKNKDKTLLIKNLSKNIKQPCIKLHKIDEVINKIAQTFAKTISTKECAINIRTECIKKTQTELNAFIAESVELLSINSDKNEYVKNQETENAIINSHVNKIPQSHEHNENNNNKSSNSEIIKITKEENFKKKHKNDMNHDYDNNNNNENNNIHKITLNKIKRLKKNLPEETLEINIAQDENVKKKYIDENPMLQIASLDDTNELFNLSDKKNLNIKENTSQQELTVLNKLSTIYNPNDENNDLDQNIQENNSNFMPSELNLVTIIENDTSVNRKNHDFMAIEKPILKDKNIQKPIQKFNSSRHFIQKYKLFKELRIFLIKFDALKNFNNKYSAKEIEKLIETYINSSTTFNVSKSQKNKKSISKISCTFKNANVNSEESINHTSNLNICETANKNICINAKEIQSRNTIIEPLLIFPKKSSLNSINKEKVKKEENLEIQKTCHNLTKIFENKSEERFKQNEINHSEQISDLLSITKPILLSSSDESINETSNSSNIFENTVNVKKSINMLDINSATKSTNEMLCLKEKKVKSSLCKQKSIPENMKVNTHLKDTTKNVVTYSSMISPIKDKKFKDKKEIKTSTYKCIVCDLNFKEYSDLQSHLIIHTQKQSNTLPNMLKNTNESSEKSQEIVTCISERKILELPKISEQKNMEYVSKFIGNNKQSKKKDITKSLINKEKKKKKIEHINNSNECSICLKNFLTKTDLAAHIYLHTENELQQAYKVAKQKLNESERTKEFKQSKTKKPIDSKNIISNAIQINEKINSKQELLCIQESDNHKSDKLIRENSKIKDIEFTENEIQNIELPMKLDKKKINKIECSKKSFTICKCHNKSGINENCLQIEIVLLCHTCRVLYRTIKCFETHYRLPEYADCNQNCLNNGRSPNLFCATCGMIFNSVQDVRHHLEIHARFKENSTMDFRCNICKVIFCGIGTLFYIHWSKHARDSLWIASEQSFPKNSIINSKLKKNSSMNLNIPTEDYIQVAEYVCDNCKLPFINEIDLKEHIQKCNKSNLFKNITIENSNNIQTHLTIKVTCNLCDNSFKKNEFYEHIKSKHNFSDPQFLCISLATAKLVFICSICMVITENFYDFEDHWLKHNIIHVNFTCIHCNTKYHNSLNSFIKHAKEHKESYNVLSCIVNYEKAKFICDFCNIGFESSQNMQEHITIHKQIYFKTDQVTNHNNSAVLSKKNHTSNLTEISTVEKQSVEKTSQMKTQTIKKINKICSTKSGVDNDTEKLIKILEGNEDDSELVIDLINQSESLNDEKSKEKKITSNTILETSCINQTNVMLKNNITKSPITNPNVETSSHFTNLESSQNILNSQMFNSNVKYTNVLQDSHISSKKINNNNNNQFDPEIKTTDDQLIIKNIQPILQNNEPQDIVSTTKELESVLTTLLKSEEEEIPPRKGFLRVKTLAELRDPVKLNKFDDHVIENIDDSINHFKSHNILNENDKQHKITEKELSSEQFIDFTSNKFEKSLYEKTMQSQKNSNILPLSLSNSNSQLNVSEIQVLQPYNTVINSQQQQRLQTNINQNKYSSSPQEVTATYHKNLPACNIARTTISPSILKRNDESNKIAKTINIQQNVNTAYTMSSSMNKNDQMSSFDNTINSNQYKYKCHYCDFSTDNVSNLLKHNLPDNHISCEKQYLQHSEQHKELKEIDNLQTKTRIMQNQNSSYEQFQQSNINQSGIKYTSLPECYQYPYITTNNSDKSTPMFKQNQQITNQPITENVSSLYYKNLNHNAGGMSIVMNQATPTIQNVPTIEFVQQPTQQQIYQSQVYNEPTTIINAQYMQQSQVLVIPIIHE